METLDANYANANQPTDGPSNAQPQNVGYWGAPVVPAAPPAPVVVPFDSSQTQVVASNSLSRTSVLLVVLGLILLGASIVPLMINFELPASYGVLAFDTLLLAGAVACTALGFAHSSKTMRNAGLAIALCAVAKIALIDVWPLDSLAEAVALIVGGVACVAIGVLYSVAGKKAKQSDARVSR